MPLTVRKYIERNRHNDRKGVFSELSGGCVILVSNKIEGTPILKLAMVNR